MIGATTLHGLLGGKDGENLGYGYLYNQYAILDANFATSGWHVPTRAEWNTLKAFLGGGSVAGGKLKETGTEYWNTPNTGATNSSGFNGYGGGHREGVSSGFFTGFKLHGWFTTSENDGVNTVYNDLDYDDTIIGEFGGAPTRGYSVRLMKDSTTLNDGETGTMTDYDGNVINTICIGTQEWTSQNWKCTKLNNGNSIPTVINGTTWAGLTTLAKCAYGNDESNV